MITSSGLMCDVCGKFILPLPGVTYSSFKCKGIDAELHCHDKGCYDLLNKSLDAKDWKMLPVGPLRIVFEEAQQNNMESSEQQATNAGCNGQAI